MKKDELEDFISQNKDLFFDDNPPEFAWNNIESNIDKASKIQKTNRLGFIRFAAAAAVLIAVTFVATRYYVLQGITGYGNNLSEVNITVENEMPKKEKTVKQMVVEPVKTKSIPVQTKNQIANNNVSKEKINPAIKDIEEINQYYRAQIYTRKDEIFRFASSGEVNQQVMIEINQLDSIYKSILKDLNDNMNNREVVESLIMQYRLKLDVLDNILNAIRESENPTEKNIKYEM